MNTKINEIAGKHLGQQGSYAVHTDECDKSLLVKIPRKDIREEWGIVVDETFLGADVWHSHESTFLTKNGLPISGTLKIVYSASSEYIVESKSLKLYLNTFDQMRMSSESVILCTREYEELVSEHLSELLEVNVTCKLFLGLFEYHREDPLQDFNNLFLEIGQEVTEKLEFDDYNIKENHLKFISKPEESEIITITKVFTDILRSRCRITSQKDSGNAYIELHTKGGEVDLVSLLKHIVSFRETNEFHEPCAEKLFQDLRSFEGVVDCAVILLYARRGGIDINPIRATSWEMISDSFTDVGRLTVKTQMQ